MLANAGSDMYSRRVPAEGTLSQNGQPMNEPRSGDDRAARRKKMWFALRIISLEPLITISSASHRLIFIAELAVHGWDVRSRFDSQAELSPESVAVIVERIPQRSTWWSFRTEVGFAPLPLRYRFNITAPTQYRVDLVVTQEQRSMEVTSGDDADVTFQCDGETFVFLMYGRIKPEVAIANGRMSCAGDQELVSAFVQRFSGG